MKYFLVLFFALLFSQSAFAQADRKSNHETDKQAEDNRAVIQHRIDEIEKVIKSVQWEPHKAPGLDTPEQERQADHDWQKWFFDVRENLHEYARKSKTYLKMSDPDVVSKFAEMNTQFTVMVDQILSEGKKFQTLSNASKARHEMAMNSIRNIRA